MAIFENQTLNQRVHSRLRAMITTGAIPLGTQLDENTLAAELGISRTPIREAIGKLVEEGLVEYRPYRGNFVRTFTVKQVDDLFEVRKTLEGLAVRLTITQLTETHLATLREILDDIEAALRRRDLTEYGIADGRFHEAIARIAGNESLIEVLDRLGAQIQVVRTIANRDPEVVERTAFERPRILAALEARDTAEAVDLMEAHIEGVRQSVVALFARHEHAFQAEA
jgi:DNA-binding GntR family transcriptional regulator